MGLTLDSCLPTDQTHVPKAIAEFITQVSTIRDVSEKILKIDDYVNRLQNEMNKIDAFRKELPLCMLLLNDAIAAMKEEQMKCRKLNRDPVLEEFIPLKEVSTNDDDEKWEKAEDSEEKEVIKHREKMNWMSSVQLWSSDFQNHQTNDTDKGKKRKEESINQQMMDDLFSVGKNSIATMMAFDGLKGFANVPQLKGCKDEFEGVAGLTLQIPGISNSDKDDCYSGCLTLKSCSSRRQSLSAANDRTNLNLSQQLTVRKQRRCWSPELHRRFVSALQHLGGAQAATPRQIRELMQVDGLTNDEVKSHLQKYRLHTRRATQPPGSLWKCGESSKTSCTSHQSGSPPGPLHLAAGSSRGTSEEDDDSGGGEGEEDSQSWKGQTKAP